MAAAQQGNGPFDGPADNRSSSLESDAAAMETGETGSTDSPDASIPTPLSALARCSFCGLGEGEVARLFQGRSGFICDECVDVCLVLLADYRELSLAPPETKRPWYQRWFGEQETLACSFTAHDADNPQGERLFSGRGIQICEQCVAACAALKEGESPEAVV